MAGQLSLRFESCVRSLSVWSSCTACVTACPSGAIRDDGDHKSIVVDLDACTACGRCVAACPTDAFSGPFDIDAVLDSLESDIVCGVKELPCIAALSTEDLVVLALRLGEVVLHDGPCVYGNDGHTVVAERVAQANRFLQASGLGGHLAYAEGSATIPAPPPKEQPVSANRRRLLLGGGVSAPAKGKLTAPRRLDKETLQYTQDRRWRLLSRLPTQVPVVEPSVPGDAVGISSSKVFHAEQCTLCTICVRICPTGALSATHGFRELFFDTSQCVRCGLCHDVCATHAITLSPNTSVSSFHERSVVLLGKIRARKCVECGMSYNAAVNHSGLCPRCAAMEEEVFELYGVKQ